MARQKALHANVDLLFLDKKSAQMVLVEVKNETANIRAVGQILDYLSQFEEMDFEMLLEEFCDVNGDARPELVKIGKKHSVLPSERTIVIAAPDFDFPTRAAQSFLSKRFSKAGLSIHLLRIQRIKHGFHLAFEEEMKPLTARQLKGLHGVGQRNRVYHLLDVGDQVFYLNIGKLSERNNAIARPKSKAMTQNLVKRRHNKLVQYDGEHQLDLKRQGNWLMKASGKRAAVILGESTDGHAYVLVHDRVSKESFFSIRTMKKLNSIFTKQIEPWEEWQKLVKRTVAANLKKQHLQASAGQ
ncbi:MAG: hypothetical protein R3C03_22125 [Pirellulaceae bacterium]